MRELLSSIMASIFLCCLVGCSASQVSKPTETTAQSISIESETELPPEEETEQPAEEPTAVEEITEYIETETQKSYLNVSDYSIVGKWKNVGEYTFGQAQKGAIIVFDGVNCNFFSPRDTYAFYKNGDNFRLDCTSPLADTVSFTVKIIDENNIDIFNGSDIVELKRVN